MPQIWKISPGEYASAWPLCRDGGYIVLGWKRLRNYKKFGNNPSAIERALGGGAGNGSGAARSILRFAYEIKAPDIVIANQGRSKVVGIGRIEGDYLAPASPENPSESDDFPHSRCVDWVIKADIDVRDKFFAPSAVTRLRSSQVNQIRAAYERQHPRLKRSLDRLFNGVLIDDEGFIGTDKTLKQVSRELEHEEAFDPTDVRDARLRALSSIVRRQGQPAFRKRLLAAYGGRCAITGCAVESLLEAAHITSYKGEKTNHIGNGILLRADLHTLFDLRLIAIDESTLKVLVSPQLKGSGYEEYRGQRIRMPAQSASQPSTEALKFHRSLYERERT